MNDMTPFPWPNGARCAVMLTFDFDAETLWLSRDPDNARRPGVLSQGIYGGKTGVPKILELLREEQLKATFFVPGWTAEKYTDRMEAIVAGGHEVGHHGYLHEWIDPDFPEKEREALEKGLEALKKTVGVRPLGYRSPAGETSANMISMLQEYGFLYDSSLMDQVSPYRHVLEGGKRGPVELPWHWSLDDAPYTLFAIKTPRAIMTNEHILSIWKQEFTEIYRWGGLVNIVTHPQIIGRPSRLAMLREFIAFARRSPDVWFATGQEVAEAWAAKETA
jgi:peptidoglycan/xylan/chitin deacetylase (PgdA/CDA1 family)